jgi:hypothetical protein
MATPEEEVFVQDEPDETTQSKLDRIRTQGFFDKAQNIEALNSCDNNVDRAVSQLLRDRFRKKNQTGLKILKPTVDEIYSLKATSSPKSPIPFFIPSPATKNIPDNIFDDDSMIVRMESSSRGKKPRCSSYTYFPQLQDLHQKGYLNLKASVNDLIVRSINKFSMNVEEIWTILLKF